MKTALKLLLIILIPAALFGAELVLGVNVFMDNSTGLFQDKSGRPVTGKMIKTSPEGRLETPLSKGMVDGTVKTYYPNGKIQSEVQFKAGQIEGLTKTYHLNGALESEQRYKDNKANGRLVRYYPSKKMAVDANYLDGKLEGVFKSYRESGVLDYEAYYVEGLKENVAKYYRENGNLKMEFNYINDRAISGYCIKRDGTRQAYSQEDIINWNTGDAVYCE